MLALINLAWRGLVRRKARYALTALGIVLGVANVFGVLVTNASTNQALQRQSQGLVGQGDVTVVPHSGTAVAERDIAAIEHFPHVRSVGRAYIGQLSLDARRGFYAVGFDASVASRQTSLERGRMFRSGRDEAVVSHTFAKARRLRIGSSFAVKAHAHASANLEVVGIFADRGPGRSSAITSVEEMTKLMGAGGADFLYVYLAPGTDADAWVVDHQGAFPALQLFHSSIPREFRLFLNVVQTALGGAAAVAIFVGAFLIYLTFTMAVVERTRMYGMLHAVGATARQVRLAVMAEALGVGVTATMVGLGLGVVLALGLLRLITQVVGLGNVALAITPGPIVAALIVGIAATVVGTLIPAARAARLAPVEAIRGTHADFSPSSRAWMLGCVLVAVGVAFYGIDARRGAPVTGSLTLVPTLFVLLGAVLIVPPLLGPFARVMRGSLQRVAPRLGDVAVMHVVRERSRSGYTLALVMVVLAMMISLGTSRASIGAALDRWVQTRFGADLLAYGQNLPDDAAARAERVPGVRRVSLLSFGRTEVTQPKRAGVQNVVAIDPDTFFAIAGFPWAHGSDDAAKAALRRGGAVLLPGSTAVRVGVKVGDKITVNASGGLRDLELVGTYASIAAGPEIGLVVSARDGRDLFGLRHPSVLYIDLTRQAAAAESRRTRNVGETSQFGVVGVGPVGLALRHAFIESNLYVIQGAQIKAQSRRALDTYFGLFLAVLVVAVVVGLLGLANTMATSVVQRFREFGVLQAVGASPFDVRRMVLAEVGLLVAGAFVLALALGFGLAQMLVSGSGSLLGFGVRVVYPWVWVPATGVLAAVVALAAAVVPARRAARLTPVEALRYE